MNKIIKTIMKILLLSELLLLCGCQIQTDAGAPIEPIVLTEEENMSLAIGYYNVKTKEVQINDLAVTADGSLAAVATAAKTLDLVSNTGSAFWEMELPFVPLKTYMDPQGNFIAVGMEDGKLSVLAPDKKELFNYQFASGIKDITASVSGEYMLVCLGAEEDGQQERMVILKEGKPLWEKTADTFLDAKFAGEDNRVIVNWQNGETPYLTCYSAEGEVIWEISRNKPLGISSESRLVISAQDQDLIAYTWETARKKWNYTVSGSIERVLAAENSKYIAVLTRDESSVLEELLYFNHTGRLLWQLRLPVDANVIVSADGERIIAASWQQYQEDITSISVYNREGEIIQSLGIAGRVQKMAYANRSNTLVLGLDDGGIYFIEVTEKGNASSGSLTAKTRSDYYREVSFSKEEGETPLRLYFYDENAECFVPVTRRAKNVKSLLRSTIQELVSGPVQDSELLRTIPKDTVINVTEKDGTVTIDLPKELDEAAGSGFLSGVIDSLLLTISSINIETIKNISFTVEGNRQETFGREGLLLEEAYSPRPDGIQEGERLLYLPLIAKNRYYLRACGKDFADLKDDELLNAIAQAVVNEYNAKFRERVELQKVYTDKSLIYVDFAASYGKMLADTPEAAARAAVLRDALALSLAENSTKATVRFTSDGAALPVMSNYLNWEITITRPYYVNPES
jgi:outer membrane protein assembly factor BamB